MHFYSGLNWNQHTLIQIGHLCPDEVLDLELDSQYDLLTQNEDMTFRNQDTVNRGTEVFSGTNPFNAPNQDVL